MSVNFSLASSHVSSACLISFEKYKTTSFPPFRVILKLFPSKFMSETLSPPRSLIRIPVPRKVVKIATSRSLVLRLYVISRFVRFSGHSASSRRRATSSGSRRIISFSCIFGVAILVITFEDIRSELKRNLNKLRIAESLRAFPFSLLI